MCDVNGSVYHREERFKGCSGGRPVPYGGSDIGDGCGCDSDSGLE